MSNFQPSPPQEAQVDLKSGLKVRCFRRDPSKFFVDIQAWLEGLEIQKIDNWTATADPSGHLTLIIAYREAKIPDPTLTLLNDTVGLVCDLAEQVKSLSEVMSRFSPDTRPSVSGPSLRDEAEVLAE